MPGSGPSGVSNSASLTVVYSTSVSVLGSSNSSVLQSSTLFLSSPPSTPTSNSTTAITAPNRLLTAPQSPQTTSPSTSSAGHVDSSTIPSSVASATSVTSTFSAAKKSFNISHSVVSSSGSSPVTYTKALLPAYSPAPFSTHGPAALDASSIWATFFTNHQDHGTGTSTFDPAPEPTSTRVPMSTPTSVSSIVSEATANTESASYIHAFTKQPKAPQQIISTGPDLITVVTQTTQSGAIFQTTITLESMGPGSLVPVPTTSSNVFPNSSSTSNSLLPLILGLVLGMLCIVSLGVTLFRCRVRRRSKYMSNTLSCDSVTSRERKDRMMTEEIPRVNAITRITPYRLSSTHTPEHITACILHAGESFQSSNGRFSDPFAVSSTVLSSRTSMPPASIRSVDSVPTNMESTVSVNTDTRNAGESGRLIDASTSSLELHFVAPLVPRPDTSIHSPYSPTWHYDGQSPTSSSREGEYRNDEEQGEAFHVTPLAPSKPFFLGTESARLRLHALLKEAGRA